MSTKSEQSQQSITSIERADRRNDLEPRRAPHWKRIAEGRYIGYRFMTRGSAGTWLARAYNPDKAFDAVSAVIHIPADKDHRARDISLANGALAHFKAQARNKLPGADLSTQADGSEWTGNAQEKHMRAAVKAAGLPKATSGYSLRHSTITDLLKAHVNPFDVAA